MPKSFETIGKECHDCGHNGLEWCSINHGVLLCDECCSIHSSLGRHISQIKSFKRSYWSPSQLNLLNELSTNGANLIWEYSLRDPQNKFPKKKPSAKDPLPIKAEFIRAKYQQMAYINRLKDETNETYEDLNLQLHSIVRTDNIITCLRFLSQGADPNFRNPETGTSSIHVAASRGQLNQIELLCIFGGNPATVDASGVSPEEHARINGYSDLADRLIELQYELTDCLICFIGGKRPNHKNNQHIVLPELNEKLDKSKQAIIARQKLQQLPDSLFEDLAMDVYDEVDRRELKTIWQTQVDRTLIPLHVVPFLPVNPSFSATRNQGRQKLARYGLKDFNTFIYDILNEVRRRYYDCIQSSTVSSGTRSHGLSRQKNHSSTAMIDSDDEPFYDKVASDDDSNNLDNNKQQKRIKLNRKLKKLIKNQLIDDTLQSPTENTSIFDNLNLEIIENHHSSDLKSRIINTEMQVKYLACAHIDLKNELSVLHKMIQRLLDESLVNKIDQQVTNNISTFINGIETNKLINKSNQQLFDNLSRKSSPFIESDYDNTTIIEDPDNPSSSLPRATFSSHDKRYSRTVVQRFPQTDENLSNNFRSCRSTDLMSRNIEKPNTTSTINSFEQTSKRDIPIQINRSRSCSGGRNKRRLPQVLIRKGSFNRFENNVDIDKRTRRITHRIADLYSSIRENQTDRYVTYAEQINNSVQDMIDLSEQLSFNDDIRANLDMLNTSTQQLLAHTTFKEKDPTMQIQSIINDCYSIALATRNLSSLYQKI
ncbi:unnamed protein product [Rotaria sp. Silwood2]|nr:unnamed protein product [Rotaria sp. Silwood2]